MSLGIALSFLLGSFATTCLAQLSASATPAAQAARAPGISKALDPSFAGLGIEPSNLYSFAGDRTTNSLTVNLLQNLADYSGVGPHLRIGGNTADNMIYDSTYSDFSLKHNAQPTGAGAVPSDLYTFGPSYWEALNRFPKGTPITFGLNLAYDEPDYLDKIVEEATACVQGLSNVKLVSFEIGNEPDLYSKNGFRKGVWDGSIYTQQWLDRSSVVYEKVLKPAGLSSAFFEPATTASTIGTSFEINLLVQDGIRKGSNGTNTFVSGWNQHDYYYFVGVSTYQLTLDHLVQLSTTEYQFQYWTTQVQQGLNTGLPYFLREMGSAGPIGVAGISDTFGASLWTLNFFLYTASLGIGSVQMHMTDDSLASPWQPIKVGDVSPHIRPSYYAFAAMAQIIGSGNGTTQVASLQLTNVPDLYKDYVRAYSVYTNGAFSAVVIVNGLLSNASRSNKGSLSLRFSLPNSAGKTLFISTLTADGTDSTEGTTWNGISFGSDGKLSGSGSGSSNQNASTVKIGSDGSVIISTRDSQAVVANLDYLLGNRAIKSSNDGPAKIKNAGVSNRAGAKTAAVVGGISIALMMLGTVGRLW